MKNYYKILDVPVAATADEIKKAFRTLALRYHPDRAPDNPFAADHFKAIQEAYEVLGSPRNRARYDEERWLRGLNTRSRTAQHISPQWLYVETIKLSRHMEQVDTYRMNHVALKEYILTLLGPEHLSMLQEAPEIHRPIIEAILRSVHHLRHPYILEVAAQLELLAGDNPDNHRLVADWLATRQREQRWIRYRPIIIISFALLMCLAIWLLH